MRINIKHRKEILFGHVFMNLNFKVDEKKDLF